MPTPPLPTTPRYRINTNVSKHIKKGKKVGLGVAKKSNHAKQKIHKTYLTKINKTKKRTKCTEKKGERKRKKGRKPILETKGEGAERG